LFLLTAACRETPTAHVAQNPVLPSSSGNQTISTRTLCPSYTPQEKRLTKSRIPVIDAVSRKIPPQPQERLVVNSQINSALSSKLVGNENEH